MGRLARRLSWGVGMTVDAAALSATAARLYDAVLLRAPWEPLLDEMRQASGSRGVWIQAPQLRTRPLVCSELECVVDYYLKMMSWRDIRAREGLRDGKVYSRFSTDLEFIDFESREQRAYYREHLEPNGCDWVAAYVLSLPEQAPLAFTFQRDGTRGPFQRDELLAFDRFIPHLKRAMTLASSFGEARDIERMDTLQGLRIPAALCDEAGRVLRCNLAFEALCGHGIDVFDRRIHAGHPDATRAVETMIRQAAITGLGLIALPPAPVHVVLPRGGHLTLAATPVEGAMRDLFRPGKVLVTGNTHRPSMPDPAVLGRHFALTPAEARLAARLAAGASLHTAADDLGITYGTARQYLKAIFAKTGTSRQAELVARLLSGQ
jgi:DNA-binding CsgD family transcriptional regulator/PAS domain-containing protein